SFCTRTPTKSLHPITKPTPGLPRPRQGSRLASGSGGSPEPPGRLSQSPLPRKNKFAPCKDEKVANQDENVAFRKRAAPQTGAGEPTKHGAGPKPNARRGHRRHPHE